MQVGTPYSVSHVPEIESRVTDGAPPRPGELEVEERLDPVHAAFEDQAVATPAQLSFNEPVAESVVAPEADRFTDDFIGVQQTEAEDRRPLEASYETRKEPTPVYTPAEPSYAAAQPVYRPETGEVPERSRPAALPIAVTLVIGLLAGFAAGYFVRDRAASETPPQAAARDAGSPTSAATAANARQWSEQAGSKQPIPASSYRVRSAPSPHISSILK